MNFYESIIKEQIKTRGIGGELREDFQEFLFTYNSLINWMNLKIAEQSRNYKRKAIPEKLRKRID